jgi:hypothetical protein
MAVDVDAALGEDSVNEEGSLGESWIDYWDGAAVGEVGVEVDSPEAGVMVFLFPTCFEFMGSASVPNVWEYRVS